MNEVVTTKLSDLSLDTLDKEKAGAISVSRVAGGVSFATALEVMEFAKLMSISDKAVPKYLRKNPGGCLAITFQAIEWRMSPFQVANKSYEVNDRVGYESQLVHAVVEARAPIQHRLECEYTGELIYDEIERKDEETGELFTVRVLNKRKSTRSCIVRGQFIGGEEREYISPMIKDIRVQNSPLWKDDPDQQLFYYASRSWARKWCPDVLMGIYTREELQELPPPDASTGLHARLEGSVTSDEGHRPGHVESELAQVAAAGGPVIEATAEPPPAETAPKAEKRTSEHRKGSAKTESAPKAAKPAKKAQEPLVEQKPPKTVKQWDEYCRAWLDVMTNADEIEARWKYEQKMRNQIGVTADDRKLVEALKIHRVKELRDEL